MLTVEHATFLSSIFTTFLANVFSVTVVGWARAALASYFGDDTAEQLGFKTLNPLAHIDIFFIFSFMLFGIGLGQYPFIEWSKVKGPLVDLKFYSAYFLNSFLYILISIISLASLLIFFGPSILELFKTVTLVDLDVLRFYPNISSFALTLALIGVAMVYINGLLAVFSLFVNLLHLVGIPVLKHFFKETKYQEIWVLVGAIALIYLLLGPLHVVTQWIIYGAGYTIAHIIGIAS